MFDHKGRRLIFNPTAEEAIRQNNINYQPPKILAAFERDVAQLMPFADTDIDDRSDKYVIWGSSPTIDRQVLGQGGAWSTEKRFFYSRLTSVKVERALSKMPLPDWMKVKSLPLIVQTAQDFDTSYHVCKSLWSSSGRGVIIDSQGINIHQRRRFIEDHIKNDGLAIQEIFLQRLVELAFLFYVHKDGTVTYLGTNYYGSASNGTFGVEYIGINPMAEYETLVGKDWESIASRHLADALREVVVPEKYHGYLGIDSMLYLDNEGIPHLRACVEVNLRMTMGNINLGIRNCCPPDIKASWSIVVKKEGVILPGTSLKDAIRHPIGSFILMNGEKFAAVGEFL